MPGVEVEGRRREMGHGAGHGEAHGVGAGRSLLRGALGLGTPAGRQEATGEQLEPDRPPRPRQQPKLLSSGGRDEKIGGAIRLAGLEQRGGERPCAVGGDDPLVEISRAVDALLGRRARRVQVSGHQRRQGAVEEVPREPFGVLEQAGALDGAVEDLRGLRQATLYPE